MSGYSGTPLWKKLGIKAGGTVLIVNAPDDYRTLLDPLPPGVEFEVGLSEAVDLVQIFTTRKAELREELLRYRGTLGPEGVVWVSWPKKSARVPTEVGEDVVRELALPLGFVDVKVCAVDEVWSGLKLVVRKSLRGN